MAEEVGVDITDGHTRGEGLGYGGGPEEMGEDDDIGGKGREGLFEPLEVQFFRQFPQGGYNTVPRLEVVGGFVKVTPEVGHVPHHLEVGPGVDAPHNGQGEGERVQAEDRESGTSRSNHFSRARAALLWPVPTEA